MNAGEAMAMAVFFLVIGFTVWVALTGWRRNQNARIEMQAKLLEKFGSTQELTNYLESDAGKQFLASSTVKHPKPYARILGATMVGIVLVCVGLGLHVMAEKIPDRDAMVAFTSLGILTLFLGVGFLLSSVVAYLLSRAWGLLNGRSKHNDES